MRGDEGEALAGGMLSGGESEPRPEGGEGLNHVALWDIGPGREGSKCRGLQTGSCQRPVWADRVDGGSSVGQQRGR